MAEGQRRWGPRKSKTSEIGAFTKRKEDSIKRSQDRKEVSIAINASVRDATFLLTTLVARGEYELLGMKKGFDLTIYFEKLGELADMFEKFTDERLGAAMREFLEVTVVERERKKDQAQEVRDGVMTDVAVADAEEML